MQRMTARVLIVFVLVVGLSCSYHRAHFSYEDYAERFPVSEFAWEGERLGEIAANEGGAFWNDCTKSARGTIWLLIDQTKQLGGNAIGEIRWIPKAEERSSGQPTCKKQWGWFLIWPVMVTPVFMSSRAEAYAYSIPEGTETGAGLYRIPETREEQEQLVDRIVGENPPFPRR
jgi:hypothetical protein